MSVGHQGGGEHGGGGDDQGKKKDEKKGGEHADGSRTTTNPQAGTTGQPAVDRTAYNQALHGATVPSGDRAAGTVDNAVTAAGGQPSQYGKVFAADHLPDIDQGLRQNYGNRSLAEAADNAPLTSGVVDDGNGNYVEMQVVAEASTSVDSRGGRVLVTDGSRPLAPSNANRGGVDDDDDVLMEHLPRNNNPARNDQVRKAVKKEADKRKLTPGQMLCRGLIVAVIILVVAGVVAASVLNQKITDAINAGKKKAPSTPPDDTGTTVDRAAGGSKGTDIDVISNAASATTGTVTDLKLYNGMADSTSVDALDDTMKKIGTWSITTNAAGTKVVHFQAVGVVRTLPSVTVAYVLTDDNGRSVPAKATLNFNDNPVAVSEGTVADRAKGASFDVVADGFVKTGDTYTVNIVTQPAATAGTAPTPTGSTIQFQPAAGTTDASATVVFTIADTTQKLTSAPATLTFTIPAATLSAAAMVSPTGVIRNAGMNGVDTDVLTSNAPITGTVVLGTNTTDATTVGAWSVVSNKIRFIGVGTVQVPSVSTQYYIADSSGKALTKAGTLTLTFSNAPIAPPSPFISMFSASARTTPIVFDVLSDPSAFVLDKTRATLDFGPDPNNPGKRLTKLTPTSGTWAVGTSGTTPAYAVITFTFNATSTVSGLSTTCCITDSNGSTCSTDASGNLVGTVITVAMKMTMARALYLSGKLSTGTPLVVNVAEAHPNVEIDPKSVILIAAHDVGQADPPAAVGLRQDGKHMVVPGEGAWTVDATYGDIGFVAEDPKNPPADVSPVSYAFVDTDGNPSYPAMIVVDQDEALPAAIAALAKLTDSQFWAAFQKEAIDDPAPDLDLGELLLYTQSHYLATSHMVGPTGLDPVAVGEAKKAYQTWQQKPYNDNLFAICAKAADAATAAKGLTAPYVARFWRLNLMANMVAQAMADAEAAATPGN